MEEALWGGRMRRCFVGSFVQGKLATNGSLMDDPFRFVDAGMDLIVLLYYCVRVVGLDFFFFFAMGILLL